MVHNENKIKIEGKPGQAQPTDLSTNLNYFTLAFNEPQQP